MSQAKQVAETCESADKIANLLSGSAHSGAGIVQKIITAVWHLYHVGNILDLLFGNKTFLCRLYKVSKLFPYIFFFVF